MKAIKFTGIVLAAVLFAARAMAQTEQLVVPLSDPGKPYKLSVDLVFGSVKVTAYDGKDVVIEASSPVKKRDDDDERKDGMKRINPTNGLDITAKEKNNVVTIGSDMVMRTLNLTIKIPQGVTSLQIRTVNGKGIEINNINSNIEVSNTNGYIALNDVSGSIVANTINGTIKGNLKSIDPKTPMAFSTLNGTIDITFPASLKANIKLKSDRGSIFTDFDVTADKQTPVVTKSSSEGMYRLKVDETISGKINGGGQELLVKTMNGNIYLRKAK